MLRPRMLERNRAVAACNGLPVGICIVFGLVVSLATTLAAEPTTTETIVMVRHGKKPDLGLGQLTCQGLNRALALPAVIAKEFGKPAAIFAPSPAETKIDSGDPSGIGPRLRGDDNSMRRLLHNAAHLPV